MSVQEDVYLILPELWLKKPFPIVLFANTCPPEYRYKIFRCETEVPNLTKDSTDVFKVNMLDRYKCHPESSYDNGKYSVFDTLCYAHFLAMY